MILSVSIGGLFFPPLRKPSPSGKAPRTRVIESNVTANEDHYFLKSNTLIANLSVVFARKKKVTDPLPIVCGHLKQPIIGSDPIY